MLAEIFMLKAEATARASRETRSTQFVPVPLPAAPAKPTSDPSMTRPEPRTGRTQNYTP
jgi:hypothetical protein